jgi:hypothetical protein
MCYKCIGLENNILNPSKNSQSILLNSTNVLTICDSCKTASSDSTITPGVPSDEGVDRTTINSLCAAVTQLVERLDRLAERLENVERKSHETNAATTAEPNTNYPPDIRCEAELRLRAAVDQEQRERADKINSLVAIGIAESKPPLSVTRDGRSNIATNDELAQIRAFVSSKGGRGDSVTHVFRMGQIDSRRARPIKIMTDSPDTKLLLFKAGREFIELMGGSRAFLRNDLTLQQRQLHQRATRILATHRANTGKTLVLRETTTEMKIVEKVEQSGTIRHIDYLLLDARQLSQVDINDQIADK